MLEECFDVICYTILLYLSYYCSGNTANLFLKKKICGCSAVNLVLLKNNFYSCEKLFFIDEPIPSF